jgi:serine/threonine-protein kinase RsbW
MSERNISQKDNIELSLPLNAAYLAAARLTASSVANRIGFDAEEIEDVKTAISEACTFIIRNAEDCSAGSFKVVFIIDNAERKSMNIALSCAQNFMISDIETDMGILMIKALMDDVILDLSSDGVFINLYKSHKANIFE